MKVDEKSEAIARFIEEECDVGWWLYQSTWVLLEAFNSWAESRGLAAMTALELRKELLNRPEGFQQETYDGVTGWVGITPKPSWP